MVTTCPRTIIPITPINPTCPTAQPKRRNKIAPKIVDRAVRKTGRVPNLALVFTSDFAINIAFVNLKVKLNSEISNDFYSNLYSINLLFQRWMLIEDVRRKVSG